MIASIVSSLSVSFLFLFSFSLRSFDARLIAWRNVHGYFTVARALLDPGYLMSTADYSNFQAGWWI
ncbi:hypothetical protein PISMIDRAFT_680314 [Pisolithus microcarpus 441]|uniref:Unplaced genomic scaffold scaffold_56, whole genome shotgun sequence n=1 Tax=Pisolithus microcarpus 441 TaxID=765257 RepID=A0A0C9YZU6_9AGAM|nr:hypothetical protein PISMIDRAFT_680314 [Pisolithus microcarpus 441]